MRCVALFLAVSLSGCDKAEDKPPLQDIVCNEQRTPRPGVTFDTLVMGDLEGHPLLVLLSRDEQSTKSPQGPRWEVREYATPGTHLLIIDRVVSGYGAIPAVRAWSSKETDRQYVEVKLPVEWIPRFTITGNPNGPRHLPEFTDQEIEAFWAERVQPLFPSK